MGQQNERIRGLDADHLSLCKFANTDHNWAIVSGRMEAIVEESGVGVPLTIPSAPDENWMEALRR